MIDVLSCAVRTSLAGQHEGRRALSRLPINLSIVSDQPLQQRRMPSLGPQHKSIHPLVVAPAHICPCCNQQLHNLLFHTQIRQSSSGTSDRAQAVAYTADGTATQRIVSYDAEVEGVRRASALTQVLSMRPCCERPLEPL